MKYQVFVDTSYLIALINKRDKHHGKAEQINNLIKEKAKKGLIELYFSDYIFDETITFLVARNISHQIIIDFGNKIIGSSIFQLVFIDEHIFKGTWKMFKKYSDKNWSFTDVSSFYIMETFRIKNFLSFDEHFTQFGIDFSALNS